MVMDLDYIMIKRNLKSIVWFILINLVVVSNCKSIEDTKSIDSLEKALTYVQGTKKADILNNLSRLLKDIDLIKATDYAAAARKLSIFLDYKIGYADALVNIGIGMPSEKNKANIEMIDSIIYEAVNIYQEFDEKRKAAEALVLYANLARDMHYLNKAYNLVFRAYNIFESLDDKNGIAYCYYLYAMVYERIEYYNAALEFAEKALQLYKEIGYKPGMAESYMLIAGISIKFQKNKQLIMDNFGKAKELFIQTGSIGNLSLCYKSIASYYTDIQLNFDSAKCYLEKAMELARSQNNMQSYSSIITHLGHIYAKVKGDYETDLKYNLEALEIRKKWDFLLTTASSYLNVGYDLIKLGRYQSADSNLKEGLAIAKKWGTLIYTRRAYQLLYELSDAQGDLKSAVMYLKNVNLYSDSIYAAEATNKTNLLKQLSETLQKDKIILELENKESKNFIWYISIITLFILASAVSLYFLYLNKKRDNLLLKKQKELIESRDELIYHLNDVNPLPVFIFDLNSNSIIYQNNSFVKFFGPARIYRYSKKNFLYLRDLNPEDSRMIFSLIKSGTFLPEVLKGLSLRIKNHENAWKWIYIRSIVFSSDNNNRPTSLLSIIIDISSQKAYEASILLRSEKTRLINEFAIEMASIEKSRDIHYAMAEWLRRFSKATGVSISTYNSQSKCLEVRAVSTESWILELFNKIIEMDIFDLKIRLEDTAKSHMLNEIIGTSEDLRDFTYDAFTPAVSKLIKTTFGINYFVGITLSYNNEIYGTALLFMPKDVNPIDEDILKTIATIAGVAIKKRLAEEELVASEQRYRELVDNSLVGIFISIENKVTFCNNRLLEIFGYPDYPEILGKEISGLVCSSERTEFLNFTRNIESRKESEFLKNFQGLRKDDSPVYLSLMCSNINYLGKNGIQFIVLDISERMLAQRAVNDMEIEFETVIDTSPDGILLLDLEGKILTGNRKTSELFTFDSKHLISRNIIEFIKTNKPGYNYIEVINELLGKRITELEFIKHDGSTFIGEISTSVIKDSSGNPKSIICMIRDITERKRSETLLQNISRLHSIGTLAGGIAHNLKNMLTSMLLNVGLAKAKPEKIPKYLSNIAKAIDQANALATKFQTFSIGGEIQKLTINVNRVIDDAVTVALSGSHIVCKINYSEDELLVDADSKQLNEVFTNLLINAKQAMNVTGKIFINSSCITLDANNIVKLEPGNYIKINFRDQGIGIPPENISKVFDPFFTTKSDGYGLGLSSVYYIIQNHKGNISVESEAGNGTEFTIYLPESKKPRTDISDIKEEIFYGNREKILIMDDDEDIRESLVEIFSVLNYTPVFTKNGIEAIEVYERMNRTGDDGFSAAILDLTIKGGESGEKVLEKLKKLNPGIKAIVFSGHSFTPVLSNYKEYGFMGILNKPVTINDISRALYDVLRK